MNLFGLSLTVLGAPVKGAETINYDNTRDGVYREIFVKNDQIVGGALVGDITGAGAIHSLMISGRKIHRADPDLLTPHGRAFFKRSWYDLSQHRSAVFIPERG
jgi:NAD(P)H-nitrite reductase large subunit